MRYVVAAPFGVSSCRTAKPSTRASIGSPDLPEHGHVEGSLAARVDRDPGGAREVAVREEPLGPKRDAHGLLGTPCHEPVRLAVAGRARRDLGADERDRRRRDDERPLELRAEGVRERAVGADPDGRRHRRERGRRRREPDGVHDAAVPEDRACRRRPEPITGHEQSRVVEPCLVEPARLLGPDRHSLLVRGRVGDPIACVDRQQREADTDHGCGHPCEAPREREHEGARDEGGGDECGAGPALGAESHEAGGRRCIRERLGRRELRDRHRGRADDDEAPEREHDRERARCAARDPRAEPDCEQGQEGEQVALGDRAHEHGGEEPDLDDEERRVGERGRDEGAQGGIRVAAGQHRPREGGRCEQRGAEAEDGDVERVPHDLVQPLGADARRLSDRRVCAEEPPGRELPTGGERDGDDEPGGRGGERGEPEERPQARAIPCRSGVDDGSEEERRQEHQRLQANGRGGCRPPDEDAVPPHRRLLERPRQHEERHRDHCERQRLRHEEPGVVEQRGDEHERCGCDGPPRRRDPARPEVGRHRDERHRERLQQPRPLDAVGEVERRERGADQRRRQQAVVRRREAPQCQGAVRPEPLAEHPVDHLVGRDPRSREGLRRCEARRR